MIVCSISLSVIMLQWQISISLLWLTAPVRRRLAGD